MGRAMGHGGDHILWRIECSLAPESNMSSSLSGGRADKQKKKKKFEK
jgi:hypothetical protein